jgi:hypothetical protein
MKKLKQNEMDVQAYTNEFYKLNIKAGHTEDDEEKVARHLNGLRYNLQDELSLNTPSTVEECYQLAIKAEENIKRRQYIQIRGRGNTTRGRGSFSNPRQLQERQEDTSKEKEQVADQRGGFKGGSSSFRGRFGGQGRGSNTLL